MSHPQSKSANTVRLFKLLDWSPSVRWYPFVPFRYCKTCFTTFQWVGPGLALNHMRYVAMNMISGHDTTVSHVSAPMSLWYGTFFTATFLSSVVGQLSVDRSVPGSRGVHTGWHSSIPNLWGTALICSEWSIEIVLSPWFSINLNPIIQFRSSSFISKILWSSVHALSRLGISEAYNVVNMNHKDGNVFSLANVDSWIQNKLQISHCHKFPVQELVPDLCCLF